MVARVLVTAVALLLAFAAFWFNALGEGHFVSPFGIMLLLLAAVAWFAWGVIGEGYRSAREGSELPAACFRAAAFKGMIRSARAQQDRSAPNA